MAKKRSKTIQRTSRPPRADTDLLLEAIQAELGSHGVVIQRGSELEGRFDLRRPTGIPSLDIAIGGGFPAGGLSQIDGPDGVGKNLLLYHTFAQIQRLYGDATNIFMLCMEFPFDKMYARQLGFRVPFSPYEIDVEQRRRAEAGLEPMNKEELAELEDDTGCGKFHVLRGSAEANLDAVVAMIGSNAYQVGAVDSWDSMLTAPEEEADLADDPRIANASTVQTRWMKKVQGALTPRRMCPECWSMELEFKKFGSGNFSYYCKCGWKGKKPHLDENETSIVGIRQVRANLNRMGMRSREWKVGGAWALKHGKLVDVQLRLGEILRSKDGKTKIGKEIAFETMKGKAGTHEGKTGAFRYFFDPPEIDIDYDFLTYCTAVGIIRRAGSVYYIEPNDLKINGKSELLEAIGDGPELKNHLWKMMLSRAGLQHVRHRDVE